MQYNHERLTVSDYLDALKKDLPTIFARRSLPKFLGGAISVGTLANFASQGIGPSFIRNGKNVIYERESFLAWLEIYLTGGIKALKKLKEESEEE